MSDDANKEQQQPEWTREPVPLAAMVVNADDDTTVIPADEAFNNDGGDGDEIGDERVDEGGAALRYDPRRVRFAAAYVRIINETGKANGAQAAREAGYPAASAKQIACALLKRASVIALIQRNQAASYSTEELKGMMIQIARGDMGMLLNDDGSFDFAKAKRLGLTYLIKEISYHEKSGKVRSVKLHSSMEAGKLLMQHEGLFQKPSKNVHDIKRAEEDRAWAEQTLERIMASHNLSRGEALEQARFQAPTVFKLLNAVP